MQTFLLRDIDPDFWAKVKSKAALERRPVKAVIYALLKEWLGRKGGTREPFSRL
jgi:hypothetical protein